MTPCAVQGCLLPVAWRCSVVWTTGGRSRGRGASVCEEHHGPRVEAWVLAEVPLGASAGSLVWRRVVEAVEA